MPPSKGSCENEMKSWVHGTVPNRLKKYFRNRVINSHEKIPIRSWH